MEKDDVTLRFSHWAGPVGAESVFFSELIFRATGRKTRIVNDQSKKVDIEIESVYGATNSNTLVTRARRFVSSHLPGGIDFANPDNSPNQQPSGNARFNIFFTGENERPPQGRWDAYLSFDLNSYKNRNEYLPLWWITSSNILVPTVSPFLGRPITIEQMLKERSTNYQSRKKFCVAFIGKAYPFRMHSIAALSDIDKVEVFGAVAISNTVAYISEQLEPNSICLGVVDQNSFEQAFSYVLFGEGEIGMQTYKVLVKYWEHLQPKKLKREKPLIMLISE